MVPPLILNCYIQSAEDGSRFLGRARTLGSSQSQTISTVSSDSSLQARLLNDGNSPNHPAAAGAEQQIINGRPTSFIILDNNLLPTPSRAQTPAVSLFIGPRCDFTDVLEQPSDCLTLTGLDLQSTDSRPLNGLDHVSILDRSTQCINLDRSSCQSQNDLNRLRHTEVDGATAAAGGHAHHQGLVVSEEKIQKLVAMGFERTQVEVAVAAADGDFNVAVEILMAQLG
ncbi:hypothetical protein RHMOL_Rhmol04G0220800 [Rhododendron molle]|uniref:Uncharacterized protein n=1 Tax=Rhododendron molle TaxID=49168 RepID=A0ACC0P4A0_RHOML|nr:hypothetical protein RHMOL_Rhmol04G0220800 [Rhododendron molle]